MIFPEVEMKGNGRRGICCFKRAFLAVFIVIISLILLVPSFRNIIFLPFWPFAWRELGMSDVIALQFFTQNDIYEVKPVESCPVIFNTTVKISDVDQSQIKTYPHVFSTKLRSSVHRKYLPIVTWDDKVSLIHLYMVLANELKELGVEFFFVQGSLLGVHRHHGVIPWDDDIDITINVRHWKLVRDHLSCINGYNLSVTTFMHWKFFPSSSQRYRYPFVDIFFYTENDNFMWAVSRSTSRSLVYAKKDTFPLTTGQFEGLKVPVPKNVDHAIRVPFDFDTCESRGMDHKIGRVIANKFVSRVPCASLTYLYDMYNLNSA